jgi:hypothetical protein
VTYGREREPFGRIQITRENLGRRDRRSGVRDFEQLSSHTIGDDQIVAAREKTGRSIQAFCKHGHGVAVEGDHAVLRVLRHDEVTGITNRIDRFTEVLVAFDHLL